jgi:glyoxylase-like metal-dependent hydrolase (beta-lactamase superfamily II)
MLAKSSDPAEQKAWRAEIGIIDAGEELAPDEIVTTSGSRDIGGRKLVLNLEHGATAGDVWVFDPATRVVAAGDLITLPVPFFDTACPARWKAALDRVAATKFDLVIPGHGQPMHRREFEVYRAAFGKLLSCGASERPKEDCINGWMADAAGLISGEPPRFVRSLLDYYVTASLRGDPAKTNTLCE